MLTIADSKFPLGQTVVTPAALERLHPIGVHTSLRRHAFGDWGEVDDVDRAENDYSLNKTLRLFSVYHDRNGQKFWIITEADRSVTTILLPSDY